MKKVICGRKYDTEKAEKIGTYKDIPEGEKWLWSKETLFKKGNGEFFLLGESDIFGKYADTKFSENPVNARFVPLTLNGAERWGREHLPTSVYEEVFGEREPIGKVKHTCTFYESEKYGLTLQRDIFKTVIPVDNIEEKGLELLDYWCVEDFDRAYIDRDKGCLVLEYETEHWLPRGYVPEEFDPAEEVPF